MRTKNLILILMAVLLSIFCGVGRAQTNITPAAVPFPTSFTQLTNVVSTNGIIAFTNTTGALTNKIQAASTNSTAQLFSDFIPSLLIFAPGTNDGMISFAPLTTKPFYKFITLQISGIIATNVPGSLGAGTNTLTFGQTSFSNPTASQIETTPSISVSFVNPTAIGNFTFVKTVEFDSVAAFQLTQWVNTSTNSFIKNPQVNWRLSY